jgi:carbamoyl-phosphate synthase large subunit
MAQVGAAVASIDTIREGFNVTSLQEYAIARREALARL